MLGYYWKKVIVFRNRDKNIISNIENNLCFDE